MLRTFLIILLAFSSIYSNFVFAKQSELVITEQNDIFQDFSVDMFEDTSASLSFHEITKISAFTPQSNRISTGYSKSNFWFRFNITNTTNSRLDYFIKFTENFAHEVDCYIASSNGKFTKYEEGVGYFKKGHKNRLNKPTFEVELNSGESKTIYIRLFGLYPNYTSFLVLDQEALNSYILNHDTLYAIYIGIILGLLLYNISIYFFSREKAYVYYALFVFSFLGW